MPETIPVILSEPRPGDAEQQELVDLITNALMSRKWIDLTIIPHLYDLEPTSPTMEFLREIEGPMIAISWLYPRAAFWTLRNAGIAARLGNGPDDRDDGRRPIWCLAMRPRIDPKAILDAVDSIVAGDLMEPLSLDQEQVIEPRISSEPRADNGSPDFPDNPSINQLTTFAKFNNPARRFEDTRERWYPVIDRDRCSGCLECLNFCLFGVYGMDSADDILIEQPDACRAGCPACSRICPEGAIMFPQHADPAISGDAKASLTGLKLDLSQLFSGAEPSALAVAERDRALSQTQPQPKPAGGNQLDDLVDELDEMEL